MTRTEYLYGVKISHFNKMCGSEQFYERHRLAVNMMAHLHKPRYIHRDDRRIRAVMKAIKWCESIIDEVEDKL